MPDIYYDLVAFAAPLPNGLRSPASGNHRVGLARLVWAAVTIGTTPFGPRLHAGRALEVQWRSAMMRASIQSAGGILRRSAAYSRLDPSEKGALSFFLAQAQAKLFAHDFFRVSRFVHYDAYLTYHGRPRRLTRPDFIGFYGRHVAIAVEAKGRSLGFDDALVVEAKKQASSLPAIAGHAASARYVHVAYFDHDQWCAYLEDPPPRRRVPVVEPESLTLAYYLPIVNAIRAREAELGSLLQTDGSYLTAYFPEADLTLSVRADVAEHVPLDDDRSPDTREASARLLYELVLQLDEAEPTAFEPETASDDEVRFLGGDGVAVQLGPSWTAWTETALG